MTEWTGASLQKIAAADELEIRPERPDGTMRQPTTIWVVRDGDQLYVRSYRGGEGSWYRTARDIGRGHIRSGGVDADVTFTDATDDPGLNSRVDAAYRAKYSRYGPTYVDPMVADTARATTLRILPR